MLSRYCRRAICALALGALLSACQLNVGIETTIDASGRGTFALRMGMDEELLTTARADTSEMAAFESLFTGLRKRGWDVTETQPDAGLEMLATRAFTDPATFDAAVAELRDTLGASRSSLIGDLTFDLRLRADKGLLSTTSAFEGSIDTAGGVRLDPHLLSALEDLVRFEVSTSLPGEAKVTGGRASSDGNRIVWRPSLGAREVFSARSEALRLGPLFVALFAILALISAAIGSVVSRRRRAVAQPSVQPTPRPAFVPPAVARVLPGTEVVFNAKPIDVEALLGDRVLRLDEEQSVRAE